MHSLIRLSAVVALAIAVAVASRPIDAGDATVVPKVYDLTQGWQIPAAGDTEATGATSAPQNGAITLAATAGNRDACVYSPIIDLTASQGAGQLPTAGPPKGWCAMDLYASQASGTAGVSITALYGVERSNVTTPSDQSGGSGTFTGTMSFYAAGQADTKVIKAFSNHIPRNAKYMRLLLKNNGGVALTIPAGKWWYLNP